MNMDNSNQKNFQKSIWKQVKDESFEDWKMFFDNNTKEKIQAKTNSEQQVKLIDYNARKNLVLGTLVMTPNGIGRLIKQDKNFSSVKLIKTNEDVNVEDNQILLYFPVYIRILDKEFSNWYKVSLPANGNVENLKKILEEKKVVEKDKSFTVVFNGLELKEETFFDQLDLRPESKLLLYGLRSTMCKVSRFTTINSWWYTYQTDGITFNVSKKIRLSGISLYGSHEGKIQTGILSIIEGNSGSGLPVMEENIEVPSSPSQSQPLTQINFRKPVNIKPNQDYTILFKSDNYCYFYYGSLGQASLVGEKKVQFNFKFTNNSSHGSNAESGNFPELFYYA